MILLNLLYSILYNFTESNSTDSLQVKIEGLPESASLATGFCSRCRNSVNGSSFGTEAREGYQKRVYNGAAIGVTRGDTVFLIIQHNASYFDTENPKADGTFNLHTQLYTSQHYVEVDKYSVLRTAAQQPYGNFSIAIYIYDNKLAKSVQYQVPSDNFFSNYTSGSASDNLLIQTNRTVSLKFNKGILKNIYWQSPTVKCVPINIGSTKKQCVREHSAVECAIDPVSGNAVCPISINVVFEGTDYKGQLMQSVGISLLIQGIRMQDFLFNFDLLVNVFINILTYFFFLH
eukprot:NODE_4_length_55019_cov_0.425091.p21 type:complete len:289 gc:universal NODE_4_length_55019_cov_0.425091:46245-47111(+)